MKAFAYLYTFLIIAVIILSIIGYIMFRSDSYTEDMFNIKQPSLIQIYNIVPFMYKIVENSTEYEQKTILNDKLSAWLSGHNQIINDFSACLNNSFYVYSSLMSEAVSLHGRPDIVVLPVDILIYNASSVFEKREILKKIEYYHAIIPSNVTFVVLTNSSAEYQGTYPIPLQYTVFAETHIILGSLSVYDVAFNVTLKINIHIGDYNVPVIFDNIQAWLLVKNEANQFLIDKVIPVEINHIDTNYVNFLVGTKITSHSINILVKISLQNGMVDYIILGYKYKE